MPKSLAWILCVLVSAPARARDGSGAFVEVRSPHFTVFSDAGGKGARTIATQLERMRALFEDIYPDLDPDPESPVVVLAMKSQKVFQELQPAAYLSNENLELRGWFLGDSGKKYILMRLDNKPTDQFPVAYHEYTHLLLAEANDQTPLWLDEGLAELYGNTRIYDRKVLLGEPNEHHLMLLRREKLLPLDTLFAIDKDSPYYIDKKKGSLFYAQSWALAHYLTLRDYEKKTSVVEKYRELVGNKIDPVTAGAQAFGDLKKLEETLDSYIRRQNFHRLETTSIAKVDNSDIEVDTINPIQLQAVEADFLACSGRLEESRALVDRVLQQEPGNPSAQATRAFLDSEEEGQTEKKLRRAIHADPSAAAAYDRLATFLWKRGNSPEEAVRLAAKAVSLDAGNVSYRIDLANLQLSHGDEEAAIETLRAAVALAKTPEETAAVDRQLKEAMSYASSLAATGSESRKTTSSIVEAGAKPEHSSGHVFVPAGPHRFLTGLIQSVRCNSPALDLTITSQAKRVALHADNYYRVQFTALFGLGHDLQPCQDLENRKAKVEYVDSVNWQDTPRLIAVELHK